MALPDKGLESARDLVSSLEHDRAWILEKLDSGSWRDLREELAELERELGQLIDRIEDKYQY